MYKIRFLSSDRDRWHAWECERVEDLYCAQDLIENMGGFVWCVGNFANNEGDK